MWNYFAAYYLHQWLVTDREFCNNLSGAHISVNQLQEMLVNYQVRRTIPNNGSGVLAAFGTELCGNPGPNTLMSIPYFINNLHNNIIAWYPNANGSMISAVSKAAWMRWRGDIVIYDSRVRQSLGLPPACTYDDFYNAFIAYKNINTNALHAACNWLVNSDYVNRLIARQAVAQHDVQNWVNCPWFQNRVVDAVLFHNQALPHSATVARLIG